MSARRAPWSPPARPAWPVRPAWLVWLVPFAAAAWAASHFGETRPWNPDAADLMVYRRAAQALLGGHDPYVLANSFPFIYPPFAALAAVPLALVPESVAKLGWTAVNVVAARSLVLRLGVRGWQLPVVVTGLLTIVVPLRSTLELGQLGAVLMVLCLVDVLDARPGADPRPRWLPVGVLVGLAAGLKLTPAVFVVLFWLVGRRRAAVVAAGTFAATVLVGLLGIGRPALAYWNRLAHGDSGANPDAFGWLHNQSVLSAWQRFAGVEHSAGGLALSGLLVAVALVAAVRCVRHDEPWLAVGLLGLASSLANPIAWAHHMTWLVPLAVGAWRTTAPMAVRLLALLAAVWWQWLPYWSLKGAPWAWAEVHQYSVGQKLMAAGGALACGAAVLSAAVAPWRAGTVADEPEPAGVSPA